MKNKDDAKYCSYGCYKEVQKKMVGEDAFNWKGGRRSDKDGYIFIRHNGEYVREHRKIVADAIGRELTADEVVHHINGLKNDNRLDNLLLFPNESQHQKFHNNTFVVMRKPSITELIDNGFLEIGKGSIIDETAWLCHWDNSKLLKKVVIGEECVIRSGATIYGDNVIGNGTKIGQGCTIREGCRIGNNTSIGTAVTVENNTTIGNFTSIETGSHITGNANIGNYVFFGAYVVTNNDFRMLYRRKGHGQYLKGATVKDYARIGSGAMLMAGITVGEHAIINAHECVRKSVPDGTLMFSRKGSVIYKTMRQDMPIQ
jgi:acetyltransferase-like isoleucine patch superfamily enzyme